MSKNSILLKGVRNNSKPGVLGTYWKTGGKLIVKDDIIVLRSFFKSTQFDRNSLIYKRENKEELLHNRIVRLYDDKYDYSVIMSPGRFNKFLTIMK